MRQSYHDHRGNALASDNDVGDDYYDAKAYAPYTREHWAPLVEVLSWLLLHFTQEDAVWLLIRWVASGQLPYAMELHPAKGEPVIVPWRGFPPLVLDLQNQFEEMEQRGW